jgi:hypothetical protein
MKVLAHAHSGSLDGTVVAYDKRRMLAFFTTVVKDSREVVSLWVGPLHSDPAFWLEGALGLFADSIARPVPVSRALLREVKFRELLKARAEALPLDTAADGALDPEGEYPPALDDAITYVAAVRDGRSPASVIASARGITRRSAEGRIARARDRGYLTPAKARTVGGRLTPKAQRALAKAYPKTLTTEEVAEKVAAAANVK